MMCISLSSHRPKMLSNYSLIRSIVDSELYNPKDQSLKSGSVAYGFVFELRYFSASWISHFSIPLNHICLSELV
jgi:hypothetical protein